MMLLLKKILLVVENYTRYLRKSIKSSKYIDKYDEVFSIYSDVDKNKFILDINNYVDRCIIYDGVFEKPSISFVRSFVKPNMVCIDVGANFGYYSIILAKLVKSNGRIIAFEPSLKFFNRFTNNIKINNLENIVVNNFGLSDSEIDALLSIGSQTATLHWVDGEDNDNQPINEKIKLVTLDNYVKEKFIDKLDFIKVDIDGHEFKFLKGAISTIKKFMPVILLEVNHLHYLEAGVSVLEFYNFIKDLDYRIFSEDKVEIVDYKSFLINACDFSVSRNIILSKNEL